MKGRVDKLEEEVQGLTQLRDFNAPFNLGLKKLIQRDIQKELVNNYKGVLQDEANYRAKVESDILKDIQVILGHQSDKIDEIADFLENEDDYQAMELLKDLIEVGHKKHSLLDCAYAEGDKQFNVDYVTGAETLAMELLAQEKPPTNNEIAKELNRIWWRSPLEGEAGAYFRSCYQNSLAFLQTGRILEAYFNFRDAVSKVKGPTE